MAKYKVPTSEVAKLINPLDCETWKCDPISVRDVTDAVEESRFRREPWPSVKNDILLKDSRQYHIERIAYLIHCGFDLYASEHKAALIITEDRCWLYDGNHRFAAAIVAKRSDIEIWIVGEDKLISEKLPSATRLKEQPM